MEREFFSIEGKFDQWNKISTGEFMQQNKTKHQNNKNKTKQKKLQTSPQKNPKTTHTHKDSLGGFIFLLREI